MGALLSFFTSSGSAPAWVTVFLDASVKGALLLLAAGRVGLVLRRASAAARHLVWFLTLASLLVLPVLSLMLPAWRLPILPAATAAAPTVPVSLAENPTSPEEAPSPAEIPASQFPEELPAGPGGSPAGSEPSSPSPPAPALRTGGRMSAWHWLLVVWGTGASLVLAVLLVGTVSVLRIVRRAHPVEADSPWALLLGEFSGKLGLRSRVRVLVSPRVSVPLACGLVRPVVLLPAESDEWPEERRRVVLLHELAHLRRRDCLTQTLAQVACALYWFNPLAWLAVRRMRIERERACDDQVLNAGLKPSNYANHLLEIARSARAHRRAALAAVAMARPGQLQGRLLAVLDPTRSRRALTRFTVGVAAAAVACLLLPLAAVKLGAAAAEEPKTASGGARAEGLAQGRGVLDAELDRIGQVSHIPLDVTGVDKILAQLDAFPASYRTKLSWWKEKVRFERWRLTLHERGGPAPDQLRFFRVLAEMSHADTEDPVQQFLLLVNEFWVSGWGDLTLAEGVKEEEFWAPVLRYAEDIQVQAKAKVPEPFLPEFMDMRLTLIRAEIYHRRLRNDEVAIPLYEKIYRYDDFAKRGYHFFTEKYPVGGQQQWETYWAAASFLMSERRGDWAYLESMGEPMGGTLNTLLREAKLGLREQVEREPPQEQVRNLEYGSWSTNVVAPEIPPDPRRSIEWAKVDLRFKKLSALADTADPQTKEAVVKALLEQCHAYLEDWPEAPVKLGPSTALGGWEPRYFPRPTVLEPLCGAFYPYLLALYGADPDVALPVTVRMYDRHHAVLEKEYVEEHGGELPSEVLDSYGGLFAHACALLLDEYRQADCLAGLTEAQRGVWAELEKVEATWGQTGNHAGKDQAKVMELARRFLNAAARPPELQPRDRAVPISPKKPEPAPPAAVGKPAPELVLEEGAGVTLAQFKGKPVALAFVSIYSRPCVKVLDDLKALQARASRDGLEVIAVHDRTARPEEIEQFRKDHPIRFRILRVPDAPRDGWDSATFRTYGVTELPTVLLIDAKGNLVSTGNETNPEEALREMLWGPQVLRSQPSVWAQPLGQEVMRLSGGWLSSGVGETISRLRAHEADHPGDAINVYIERYIAELYAYQASPAHGEEPQPLKAIETFEHMFQQYPSDNPVVIDSKIWCSTLYSAYNRNLPRARELCQEALRDVVKVQDGLTRDLLWLKAHCHLGAVCAAEGDLAGARAEYMHVLNYRRMNIIPSPQLHDFLFVRDGSAGGLVGLWVLLPTPQEQLKYLEDIDLFVSSFAGDALRWARFQVERTAGAAARPPELQPKDDSVRASPKKPEPAPAVPAVPGS